MIQVLMVFGFLKLCHYMSVNKYNPFTDWRLKVNSSAMLLCSCVLCCAFVTVHAQIESTSWPEFPSS